MARDAQDPAPNSGPTADDDAPTLDQLPTTDSGTIRKSNAMAWMQGLDEPTDADLLRSVTPKPYEHSGSTFATDISQVRLTGDAAFIEAVAGLLTPLLAYESSATRVDLSVKETEDRETGALTGNYALYLTVVERGQEGAMREILLARNSENDDRLLDALDE